MSNPVGRPTDYKPEYSEKVNDYLKTTGREQTHLPKIVSFAKYLGVGKNTLYEWGKKYPEFQDALDQIMENQEEILLDDGIYGGKEVNSTIVKLALSHNHGYREKSDMTTDGKEFRGVVIYRPEKNAA